MAPRGQPPLPAGPRSWNVRQDKAGRPRMSSREIQQACAALALALSVPVLGVQVLSVPAHAQPVETFYRGKTITMIVPADPGGSYDLHTRLIARHIGKRIPGQPAVIVQNMPG